MALKRIIRLSAGKISANGQVDVKHTPEVNLVLKRIIVVEETGASVNKVFATLYLGEDPYFSPDVSLALFLPNNPAPIELNIEWPAHNFQFLFIVSCKRH